MRHIKPLFFLLVVTFSLSAQADKTEEVRKSVDASGKVIFSKPVFSDKKPAKKSAEGEVKAPPKSTAPKVEIYYASWDPHSNEAILFFREKHIVAIAYDIDLDATAAARKKKIDPGFVGMPLVIINGIIIRGVDKKKYEDALSKKPQ